MPSARDVYSELGMTDLIDVGLTRGERLKRILYLNLDGTVKVSQSWFGGMNTWIQRHRFLALLYDFIQEHHSDSVKVLFNTRVTTVDVADDGSGVTVHAQTTAPPLADNGETDVSFAGRLVVAADGAISHVRQALEKAQSAEDWKMREAPSDSAGLYVRVCSWSWLVLKMCVAACAPDVGMLGRKQPVVMPARHYTPVLWIACTGDTDAVCGFA
eukprot:jgi/Ulvmu1/1277/UM011_0001.1